MIKEFQNPEFWVGFSFCLVIILMIFPVSKKLSVWGKNQAKIIKDELDSASQLKEQAEKLYAEYTEHTKNLEKEQAAILRSAEEEVMNIQQDADEKISTRLALRKRDVEVKIHSMEENAAQDVTQVLLNQVMTKTKNLLSENPIRQTEKDMDVAIDKIFQFLEAQIPQSK
ncbi:MAG: hypothetical protein E7014_07090 [Alphaproteobacteria bacterium]|nr:hypothetical protein [Alphaproteobacteria bacterium]